jgi:hypothetical protein
LKEIEKREIMKRIWEIVMKNLIRDPIFDKFTRQIIVKLFSVFRLPNKLLEIIFSIVSYFRYYAYIA